MADTLKQMYFGVPGTSNGTVYTAPGSGSTSATAIVRYIQVCNTTASAATISIGLNGTAATAANRIYSTFSVPANGVHFANVNIVLEGGDTLQALQGTSSALNLLINGVEL